MPAARECTNAAAARLLGEKLRALRARRGLGLKDVAPIIGASVSKISRLELARSPAKYQDVMALASHYAATSAEKAELEVLYQQSQNSDWYEQYADVTTDYFRRLIALEGQANRIMTYENMVVPGLLQIRPYAKALLRAGLPTHSAADIDRLADLREKRQVILRDPAPEVVALIDEGVLRRPVGGVRAMYDQLNHLLELGDDEELNISIGIVPFLAGALASPPYPITHLRFADGGPAELVYVEILKSANYVTRASEIKEHMLVLENLMSTQTGWAASRSRIEAMRDEYAKHL